MTQSNGQLFPEDIYKAHLQVINGIKFTPREIDIISCVVCAKNVKDIANFLSSDSKSMAERTVETNILNIRRKISGGSRSSIVTFIEKSDKYQWVRSYYISLVLQKEFCERLQKVALILKQEIADATFTIVSYKLEDDGRQSSNTTKENSMINYMQNHLKLLGANVIKETKQIPVFSIESSIQYSSIFKQASAQNEYKLHILPQLERNDGCDLAATNAKSDD